MKNVKSRIDVQQDVLEAYQSANPNRREDMFAIALDLLSFEALNEIHIRYAKKNEVPS